ncbi:MAG: zinc-binding dehydrogenase [Chitinophagia bacterium]|jgi:NADPH:quinone reductase-like Zn-dependent oxidoreductase/acyl dehydratase
MKAILCTQYGGPQLLSLREIPSPIPEPNQVLVQIHACGVNFPDSLLIQNLYQFKPALPFSPGGEIAGIVLSIGNQVNNVKPGDRVLAITGWGGFAEEIVINANQVLPIPASLSFNTAAASGYQYGTALYALKNIAVLKPGEKLLVMGAAGGVGLAAVELGKLMGATVIAAASNEKKLAACKNKGADYFINYEEQNLAEAIKKNIPGGKVDVIFDPVGGNLTKLAIRTMAWKGRYLVIGFAAGEIPQIPLNLPLLKGFSIQGVFWGSFIQNEPMAHLENTQIILQWLLNGKLHPHIHHFYSLDQAPQALEAITNRTIIGKAIITPHHSSIPLSELTPIIAQTTPIKASINSHPIIRNQNDIQQLIGKTLGPGNWITLTTEMIQQFAELTGDRQWIHVDTERAKNELPEGKILAHGFFTLSMASNLLYQLIDLTNVKQMFNYGLNKARFITPVSAGNRIRMKATLTHTEPGKNGGIQLFISCVIETDISEKPACVAELVSLIFVNA